MRAVYRVGRTTGLDCVVVRNLINTHTRACTHTCSLANRNRPWNVVRGFPGGGDAIPL